MKTKNNVQKTALKFSAVIISLVLIGLTVNAQGLRESLIANNTFKTLAFAMVENHKEYKTKPSDKNLNFSMYSEFIEESIEETLELESWMTNESLFTVTSIDFELETENQLDLENWMFDDTIFISKGLIKTDSEEKLTIEHWMLDGKVWDL